MLAQAVRDFVPRTEIERIALSTANRITLLRWREYGFRVALDAESPGQDEEETRKFFDHLRTEYASYLASKGRWIRMATTTAAILGGLATFSAVMYGAIAFLTGHVSWK